MSADEEIVFYLSLLLDHYYECELESCPTCLKLHAIAGSIRNKLFSGPVFADVPIADRRAHSDPGTLAA